MTFKMLIPTDPRPTWELFAWADSLLSTRRAVLNTSLSQGEGNQVDDPTKVRQRIQTSKAISRSQASEIRRREQVRLDDRPTRTHINLVLFKLQLLFFR